MKTRNNNKITNSKLRQIFSAVAFGSSITIGFIGLFLPPTGIIDSSVLFFTAQLLCFVAALLGFEFNFKK